MISIYSKKHCPNCDRAVFLCKQSNQPFTKFDLGSDFTREELLDKCAPAVPRELPQIFISGIHVGGVRELESFLKKS